MMMKKIKNLCDKKKIIGFLILFCTFAITLFIFDARRPDRVEAQSCISVIPQIIYGYVDGVDSGGCVSRSVSVAAAGVGMPWVGLTGWRLRYTNDDHEVDHVEAGIRGLTATSSRVNFTIEGCLNDQNNDDDFRYYLGYVVVRWR